MPGAEPLRRHGAARPVDGNGTAAHPRRAAGPDETALDTVAPDAFARLVLSLLRWHFQTFAQPGTQGWLTALRVATAAVGPHAAGPLCFDVVALVQTLRAGRRTPIGFNNDGCACCRVWLTPDERRLMELLAAQREGRTGRARIVAQMLADGVPAEALLAAVATLAARHAPPPPA